MTTAWGELAVAGVATSIDGNAIRVAILVRAGRRRAGQASSLVVEGPGFRFEAEALERVITTARGWVHVRGSGHLDGSAGWSPFRADFRARSRNGAPDGARDGAPDGSHNGAPDTDHFSMRVYANGSDPATASPIAKVTSVPMMATGERTQVLSLDATRARW
jgi:hypothetical protein